METKQFLGQTAPKTSGEGSSPAFLVHFPAMLYGVPRNRCALDRPGLIFCLKH